MRKPGTNLNHDSSFSIFNIIFHEGPISRVDISKKLTLSKASVSKHVTNLVDQKLCFEKEDLDYTKVGRKPILLDVYPNYCYLVSLVLENTKSYVVLSNLAKEQLDMMVLDLPFDEGHDYQVEFYKDAIQKVLSRSNIAYSKVKLLSVCSPGYYDNRTDSFYADGVFQNWNISDLCNTLSEIFQWPTLIVNDMNAAAWGEYSLAANRSKNMLYIGGGRGLGASIIIDGKLHEGWTGEAGEISSLQIAPDPITNEPLILSQIATFKGVLERVKNHAPESTFHYLNIKPDERNSIRFKDIYNLIRVGEAFTTECLFDMAEEVARLVCNLVMLLNCELVIIGGEFVDFSQVMKPVIEKHLQKYVHAVPELLFSNTNKEASIYGLLLLSEKRLLENLFTKAQAKYSR